MVCLQTPVLRLSRRELDQSSRIICVGGLLHVLVKVPGIFSLQNKSNLNRFCHPRPDLKRDRERFWIARVRDDRFDGLDGRVQRFRHRVQSVDISHADGLPTRAGIDKLDHLRFRDFLRDTCNQALPGLPEDLLTLLQNMNPVTRDTLFSHDNRELRMRIKFCGTTSLADMQCGIDAGCDALGFIMGVRYQSSDFVTPEDAARLIQKLPPFIEPVAVTHLRETEDLIRLVRDSHCTTLQIQDTIEPAEIGLIRDALPYIKIIKAIHVTDESAIEAGKLYEPHADALLLDSRTPEKIGGTGIPHDWRISAKIVAGSSIPVILAGGLTPENVYEAIRQVRPYGVDVHTGIKRGGIRNPERTRAFAREARKALSSDKNEE